MTKCVLRVNRKRYKAVIEADENYIWFRKSPFSLKDEIKAMRGARWDADRRKWKVRNCPANHFQLQAMIVEPQDVDPYAWFDRDLEVIDDVTRPLKPHQIEIISKCLTYRYQLIAADMGLGKTLCAIEIMERLVRAYGWSGDEVHNKVWFVGPKPALESIEADFHKWGVNLIPRRMTYENLLIHGKSYIAEHGVPQVVIMDECTAVKTPSSQRTVAAQELADAVRAEYATDGCVVLLSGSPTAKRPSDIWSQAEVAWPGFLREGSLKAFEERYAIVEEMQTNEGIRFTKVAGWKDDEVDKIPARLDGLMSVYRKDDILDLPTRTYTRVTCPPTKRTLRVAKVLTDTAESVIVALTRLRTLSSGFQYKDDDALTEDGERQMVETSCPKDDKLVEYLQREDSRGRMIVFASFQGSIDRVKRICREQGWDQIVIDGRGWNSFKGTERVKDEHFLDFWANNPNKTVFIGNPASCRFGLTLTEAKTIVVYDQNFSAEHRLQSLDRNYRIGQDEPVEVVDLLHLPVDELILDTLSENKRLEELSLGLIVSTLGGTSEESDLDPAQAV